MLRTIGLEPTRDLRPLSDLVGEKQFLQLFIEQVGVRRIVAAIGLKRIIEVVGRERILDEMGLGWLNSLTPEQLEELKRRALALARGPTDSHGGQVPVDPA